MIVLILAGIGSFYFLRKSPQSITQQEVPAGQTSSPKKSTTWNQIPVDVAVPEKGVVVPKNVASPETVVAAAIGSAASYRGYDLKIQANAFSPDTVIVRQGDVAHIVVVAVDGEYDVTQPDYGFHVVVPRGQTKTIQFGATAAGTFTFYCAQCGGPAKGPVGKIIVAPKP